MTHLLYPVILRFCFKIVFLKSQIFLHKRVQNFSVVGRGRNSAMKEKILSEVDFFLIYFITLPAFSYSS